MTLEDFKTRRDELIKDNEWMDRLIKGKGVGVFDEKLSAVTSQEQETRYEKSKSLEQSRDQLEKLAKQYGNQALYLLAGQPDDLATIRLFLEERGIGRERLRLEEFKGLK